jgi:aspartyl-tRNA synthetase
VHDPTLLVERMKLVGIEKHHMRHYVEAFELGAPPHAGAGLGKCVSFGLSSDCWLSISS